MQVGIDNQTVKALEERPMLTSKSAH